MGEQLYLERYLWFDREARQQKYPNASTLARQFEISVKTALRSIDHFRDRLGAPLEYDKARKGFFYDNPSFLLPALRISEEELLALLISRKLISEASAGYLAEELGSISHRLGTLLSENLPGRANPEEALSFRWKALSPTDPLVFQIVTAALLQGKLLTFCYYSPNAASCTMRTVEPHHMVNYMGTWHLIAYCRLRHDWRDFVLGRMTLCQVAGEAFRARGREQWQPFLEESFGIFQNPERFDVVLRFTPERSRWVKEEVWHEAQREEVEDDGSLVRTVTASHEAEILMEILKHGSHVEVLAPAWLRDKVIEEIDRTRKKYPA